MPLGTLTTRGVAIAFAAATILLSGCARTPVSTDVELAQRIAVLEARLAEKEEIAEEQSLADKKRLANIENQLSNIINLLQTTAAAPAATLPATDESLLKRSDEFKFQGRNDAMAAVFEETSRKFTDGDALDKSHFRNEWIGRPLPQARFVGPHGDVVDLRDFQGTRNIVLVFLRGFPGFVCPTCSAQTIALLKNAEEFEARDAQVVLVYPGAAESVPAFLDSIRTYEKDAVLPFPILLDVNLGAVQAFAIEGALAKPTSVVVDKEGLIQFAYVGEAPDDRPSVKTLLEALDEIGAE